MAIGFLHARESKYFGNLKARHMDMFKHTEAFAGWREKRQAVVDQSGLYATAVETLPIGHPQIAASRQDMQAAQTELDTFVGEVLPDIWARVSGVVR